MLNCSLLIYAHICSYNLCSLSDDESEELVFARFLHAHRCYALMPNSSKLVVFDTNLTVSLSFNFSLTLLFLKQGMMPHLIQNEILSTETVFQELE